MTVKLPKCDDYAIGPLFKPPIDPIIDSLSALFGTRLPSSMTYLFALNCGSSSLKYRLYSYPALELLSSGKASEIGTDEAKLQLYFVPSDKKEQHEISSGTKHAEVRERSSIPSSEEDVYR
jgi:hypothetical protein